MGILILGAPVIGLGQGGSWRESAASRDLSEKGFGRSRCGLTARPFNQTNGS